jgi:hypothetical protein
MRATMRRHGGFAILAALTPVLCACTEPFDRLTPERQAVVLCMRDALMRSGLARTIDIGAYAKDTAITFRFAGEAMGSEVQLFQFYGVNTQNGRLTYWPSFGVPASFTMMLDAQCETEAVVLNVMPAPR